MQGRGRKIERQPFLSEITSLALVVLASNLAMLFATADNRSSKPERVLRNLLLCRSRTICFRPLSRPCCLCSVSSCCSLDRSCWRTPAISSIIVGWSEPGFVPQGTCSGYDRFLVVLTINLSRTGECFFALRLLWSPFNGLTHGCQLFGLSCHCSVSVLLPPLFVNRLELFCYRRLFTCVLSIRPCLTLLLPCAPL